MKSGLRPGSSTDHKMPDYHLSKAAKADLISIAQYGDENFGMAQSDHYRDQFKKRFSILAKYPERYPTVNHIRTGYRRSICGVHSIYYRVEQKGITIVRVLGRQEIENSF